MPGIDVVHPELSILDRFNYSVGQFFRKIGTFEILHMDLQNTVARRIRNQPSLLLPFV